MARPLPVRRPQFDLSEVPKDWVQSDQQLTHVLNGLFALFPDGERFFCRAVRDGAAAAGLEDERLKGFYGQEAHHGVAHRAALELLEAQGYEMESWMQWYRARAYGRFEPMWGVEVRLATTAALEHFTATLAEVAFDPDDLVADCHPAMQELIFWHAAEEIEHRAVAYDVLQQVDPRLRTRWVGFVMAVGVLTGYGMSAASHLGRQDGLRGNRRRLVKELVKRPKIWRNLVRFCRPGFHPDEEAPLEAAVAFLAALDAQVAA